MGLPRQDYWGGFPFPSPGDLPYPSIEPGSPALQEVSCTSDGLWQGTLLSGRDTCQSRLPQYPESYHADKYSLHRGQRRLPRRKSVAVESCTNPSLHLLQLLPLTFSVRPFAYPSQVSQAFHLLPSKFTPFSATFPHLVISDLDLPTHVYAPSYSLCLPSVVKNQAVEVRIHCTYYSWDIRSFSDISHAFYSYLSSKSSVPINGVI